MLWHNCLESSFYYRSIKLDILCILFLFPCSFLNVQLPSIMSIASNNNAWGMFSEWRDMNYIQHTKLEQNTKTLHLQKKAKIQDYTIQYESQPIKPTEFLFLFRFYAHVSHSIFCWCKMGNLWETRFHNVTSDG